VGLVPVPTGVPASGQQRAALEICLVSMPTATDFEDPVHFESKGVRRIATDLPLGVLALGAVLENRGFTPRIVDSNLWYLEYVLSAPGHREGSFGRIAAERLAGAGGHLFGFSTICNSYPVSLQIAQHLKALRPDSVILFGGPQASVVDTATLRHFPFVDFILRGEADHSLPELAACLASGASPESVPGLTYRRGAEIRRNPDSPVPTDMDSLPLPAFHLHPAVAGRTDIPLELGRGCPFGCTFCSTNDFFRRRFRLKSPARLIAEMDELQARYQVTYFDFVHDMFTVDRKRVVAFCEALLATGRSYRWGCSARTDCIDEDLISLMARAGCQSIFFGIETGSARMQKIISKRLDLEESRRNAALTSSHGMTTTLSTITGFPEETPHDLRDTVSFLGEALRLPNTIPQLHLLAPLAGTPLHRKHEHELILEDICADMSHAGWLQRSEERDLAARYPDVFPNFYAIPTPHLDRRYLHELREFLQRTFRRFRWLMAALQQECGDLLLIFDQWVAWSGNRVPREQGSQLRRYYSTAFDREFVKFLQSRTRPAKGPFETVLLEFEAAFFEVCRPVCPTECEAPRVEILESDMLLDLDSHVHLLRLNGDVNRVVELLQAGLPPDESVHRPVIVATRMMTPEDVDVNEVPPLLAAFLELCDGTATVDEVLCRFESLCRPVGGMSSRDLAEYALQSAYEKKLIRALRPEPDASPRPTPPEICPFDLRV
jgi:radical SAM superfamily enzyme YgiQ (UPF0313 family)